MLANRCFSPNLGGMLSLEDLSGLLQEHGAAAAVKVREFSIGDRFFGFNSQPAIVGVVNLSPDSWYRESVCLSADKAIEHDGFCSAQGTIASMWVRNRPWPRPRASIRRRSKENCCRSSKGLLSAAEKQLCPSRLIKWKWRDRALEAGARVLNLTGTEDAARKSFPWRPIFRPAVIICHVQGRHVREVGDFDLRHVIPAMKDIAARQTELAAKAGSGQEF